MGFDVERADSLFHNVKILKKIRNSITITDEENIIGLEVLERLQNERKNLKDEYRKLNHQLNDVGIVLSEQKSYSEEVQAQIYRLKSIELFEDVENMAQICPLCNTDISNNHLPKVEDIKNSIKN